MTTLDVDHFRELLVKREAVAAALENSRRTPARWRTKPESLPGSADQHLRTRPRKPSSEIGSTLEEHDERLLVAIDAALQRIENGTYGKCVNCGAPIPEERLEAMPWATLCIDCKRKEERARPARSAEIRVGSSTTASSGSRRQALACCADAPVGRARPGRARCDRCRPADEVDRLERARPRRGGRRRRPALDPPRAELRHRVRPLRDGDAIVIVLTGIAVA